MKRIMERIKIAMNISAPVAVSCASGCVTAMSVVNDSACKVTSVLDAALLADGAPPLRILESARGGVALGSRP